MTAPTEVRTITEAKANLSRLIAAVERGEVIVIGRAGKPVAKLVAYEVEDEPRDLSAGTWKGRVKVADDFDELPADFLEHFVGAADAS